ncbi:MAG: hypothetical protein WCX65_05900 [bacterium]
MKTNKIYLVAAGVFLALIIAGCGGGGGSSSAPALTTISGTVSAPSGIALGRQAGREAEATGLVAKAGASVDVYLIDDTGTKSGSSIATGAANSSGVFSITLPANVSAAGNLVVSAGSGVNLMRSFVTGSSVNINPLTELVVAKVAENAQPLSSFTTTELANILAQVETDALDVNLSGAGTINDAKTALYTAAIKANLDRMILIGSGNSQVDGYYVGTDTNTSDTCNITPDYTPAPDSFFVTVVNNSITINHWESQFTGTYNSSTGAFSVSGTTNYISTDELNRTCTANIPSSWNGTLANGVISGTWQFTASAPAGQGCLLPANGCAQSGTMSLTKTNYVALSAPALTTPANNATGVSANASLAWNAVAGASGYEVQAIPASFGGGATPYALTLSAPSASFNPSSFSTPLTAATVYQWKVRAFHGEDPISSYSNSYCTNCSQWSETRTFTTQ